MEEGLLQGISKAMTRYFEHLQIVPNASSFQWLIVLPRKIPTLLQLIMHGRFSHGAVITLLKSVSPRIDS